MEHVQKLAFLEEISAKKRGGWRVDLLSAKKNFWVKILAKTSAKNAISYVLPYSGFVKNSGSIFSTLDGPKVIINPLSIIEGYW